MSVVVHRETNGPIRARLEAEGMALALFDPKFRNDVVRLAMKAGGDFWVNVFLPKRFSQYAFSMGYRVSSRWRKYKEFQGGVAVPFVGLSPPGGGPIAPKWKRTNPEKMITAALGGARASATATANRARIVVSIPYGHAIQPETSDMFRFVPSWEMERVAQVVGKSLQDLLDGLLPAIAINAKAVSAARRQRRPVTTMMTGLGERVTGTRSRSATPSPRRTG